MFLNVVCFCLIFTISSTIGQLNLFLNPLNNNLQNKRNAQPQGQIGSFIRKKQQHNSRVDFAQNSYLHNFGEFSSGFISNGNHFGHNNGNHFGHNNGNYFGHNNGNHFGHNNGNHFGHNHGNHFGHNNGNHFGHNNGNHFGQDNGNQFKPIPNMQIPNTDIPIDKPDFGFLNPDFVFQNIFFGLNKTTKRPTVTTGTETSTTSPVSEPNKVTKPNKATEPNTITAATTAKVTEPSKVTSVTEPVTKSNQDLDDYFDVVGTSEPAMDDKDKIDSYIKGFPVILLKDWDIRK